MLNKQTGLHFILTGITIFVIWCIEKYIFKSQIDWILLIILFMSIGLIMYIAGKNKEAQKCRTMRK